VVFAERSDINFLPLAYSRLPQLGPLRSFLHVTQKYKKTSLGHVER
jgi:hypothetical protein